MTTSNEKSAQVSFSYFDIIFFSLIIIISALVGLYFSFKKKQFTTIAEYLMGNSKMKTVPVGISLLANKISAINILAIPSDVYRFGAGFWVSSFSTIISCVIVIYVYLPVFFKRKTISMYEYLEKRFDTKTKILGSFIFVLNSVFIIPMLIYTSAITFSTCTGVNIHLIIWLICGVCTFYTTIGGLKTVIWTDVLQFIVIVVGYVMVVILGLKSVGGLQNVWVKAANSDRLDIFNFDPDPTRRDSFWMVVVGYTVTFLSYFGVTQDNIQKICSVPTATSATKTLIFYGIGTIIFVTFNVLIGLTMYAKYSGCDPFLSKELSQYDQLVPYFVMDIGKNVYGLSSIFLGTIVCAALSSLSVSFSTLAGVIYKDFVSTFMKKDLSQKKALNILKAIVIIVGFISGIIASFFDKIDSIFSLVISLSSLTHGPKLAMFTVGMLIPRTNAKGVFYGTLGGFLLMLWFTLQTRYYQYQGLLKYNPKPLSTETCNLSNDTFLTYPPFTVNETISNKYNFTENFTLAHEIHNNQKTNNSSLFEPHFIFRISFYYSTLIATVITMILVLAISFVTNKDDSPVDKDLISPVCQFFLTREHSGGEDLHRYSSIETAVNKLQENAQ